MVTDESRAGYIGEKFMSPKGVRVVLLSPGTMSKSQFANLLENTIQAAERTVREQGQREYAHDDTNAFANFDRLAILLGISRERVLWCYLQKHLDGILAHINGRTSQREDVRGRIKDARLYLALLWGMVDCNSPIDTPDTK